MKPRNSLPSEADDGVLGSAEPVDSWRKADAIGQELSAYTQWTPRGRRGRHVEKERTVKARNHSLVAEVLRLGTQRWHSVLAGEAKSECAGVWGAWGR